MLHCSKLSLHRDGLLQGHDDAGLSKICGEICCIQTLWAILHHSTIGVNKLCLGWRFGCSISAVFNTDDESDFIGFSVVLDVTIQNR